MSLNFLFGNVDEEGQLDLEGIDDSFKEALAEVGSAGDAGNSNSFLELALGGGGFSLDQSSILGDSESDSNFKTPSKKTKKKRKYSQQDDFDISDASLPKSNADYSPFLKNRSLSPERLSDSIIADPSAIDYSNIDEAFSDSDDLFDSKNNKSLYELNSNSYLYFSIFYLRPSAYSLPFIPTYFIPYLNYFCAHARINTSLSDQIEPTSPSLTANNDLNLVSHTSNLIDIIKTGKPLKFTDIFGSYIEKKTRHHKKNKPITFSKYPKPNSSSLINSTINNLDYKKLCNISANDQSLSSNENKSKLPNSDNDHKHNDLDDIYSLSCKNPSSETIKIPFGIELDDWEDKIIWDENDLKNTKISTSNIPTIDQNGKIIKPINTLFDSGDWINDIIWDLSLKNKRISVATNTNDPLMIIDILEQKNLPSTNILNDKDKYSLEASIDKFNLSNDLFYDALQEGKVQRVRQTFGQLLVKHSLPSVHLQPPLFRIKFSRQELRNWHRPKLTLFPKHSLTENGSFQKLLIKFSKVKSKKKKKKSKNLASSINDDTLWSASDITLRDSAEMILVEYSEEFPPIMSNVGMGAALVNYYRKTEEQDNHIPDVSLGDLFILGIADASPFLNFGNVMPGQTISVLHNNMFRAPLFSHKLGKYSARENKKKPTDFLGIRRADIPSVRSASSTFKESDNDNQESVAGCFV
ncbi:putative transcription initiation factor TFIID [Smittium culicis]|uniref:Putative transcription initiation factor TFIID n=1 Tax=Smittium culicis TaxID=133412 RepID=A0A1R1YI47_9FUNG|nr:putative transcription initiation factor TFIID [Smittium culicis]